MDLETVTVGSLIDSTLLEVESASERGLLVTLQDALSAVDTTFQLSSGELNVSDLVEFGLELMLVGAKSDDLNPTYTVSRAYLGSTPGAVDAGTVGVRNPQFPRRRVMEALKRSLPRIDAMGVPIVKSFTTNRTTLVPYAELPADCRQVLRIVLIDSNGRINELDGWRQYAGLPTSVSATEKVVHIPPQITDDIDMHIMYRSRYSWPTNATEASTIELPYDCSDLPSSYAAAWLIAGREISRAEIDRSNEHSTQDQVRVQSGVGLMRSMWQSFYRSLDEARRLVDFEVPKHRPLIVRPKYYLG